MSKADELKSATLKLEAVDLLTEAQRHGPQNLTEEQTGTLGEASARATAAKTKSWARRKTARLPPTENTLGKLNTQI
jgi:hypothetical protein